MIFSELMAGLDFDGALTGRVPDNWRQGRTLYGGITAALLFEAARRAFPDLPPLRSAEIAYVGPAEGDIRATASMLRRGKSVAFVGVDLEGERGLAARAIFAFGAARPSLFAAHFAPAPAVPGPDAAGAFGDDRRRPDFARNFEVKLAAGAPPMSGAEKPDALLWVRHRDRNATSLAALIALADMPPPAMMPMFKSAAPISTMTWSFNMLSDDPPADDGWRLLSSVAENAADGYSSQDMLLWSRTGEPMIAGRQSVAIFL